MHNVWMDKYALRRKALRALIDKKYQGIIASFAKAVDIDNSYVSRMLYPDGKDGRKRIGEDTIEKINIIHPNWLVIYGGIGTNTSLLLAEQDRLECGNIGEKIPLTGRVPLISFVEAGAWSDVVDNFEPGSADVWLSCPVNHSNKTFALKVRGVSMFSPDGEKSFAEGDIIFVDPERPYQHRSLVVAKLEDSNEATFKRLLIDGDNRYLEALNTDWKPRYIQINGNCHIVGVVIAKLESYV